MAKKGSSRPGFFGGYTHYDSSGKKTGSSYSRIDGGYTHTDGDACYIAACVYGDYDCPQVWTLHRFRDGTLKATAAGRAFIRAYYVVSPKLVRLFGESGWFRRF